MYDLNIIIPSFNRAHLLKWNLEALCRQRITSNYIITVYNDGLDDDTKNICQMYRDRLPIEYIFTGERNRNGVIWRNPGWVINYAIKRANSKHIILSCAEIFLVPFDGKLDTIEEMIRLLNENSRQVIYTDRKSVV